MRFRLFRFAFSFIWIAALITLVLLYFYYYFASSSLKGLISGKYFPKHGLSDSDFLEYSQDSSDTEIHPLAKNTPKTRFNDIGTSNRSEKIQKFLFCYELNEANATINTQKEYQKFDFNADWISKKSIWNEKFEEKFKKFSIDTERPPLHIVVMPHSHNDPGWLKTFEGYFESHTHSILNNAVKKLPVLDEMTFIWTEISFLELWWQKSDKSQHDILKNLVTTGRVEIMTGGWVMTDEAAAHIYSMVDQLIEGHQWIKTHLNVTPKHSWSIDPFGHGSTMPYIYGISDIEGSIIQRIHYNWKEWLASRQFGDFIWRPSWETKQHEKLSVLTHNMPFDMYFVDSSCGPHVDKCKPYDFRWFGSIKEQDLQSKADQLVAEYARSASLYPHNTFLAIVGGDFRYETEYEFDAQYNYKKIIDYVNSNQERYNNTKMQFGTPKDYFKVIRERTKEFPTLSGDLFPYGDVFTNGEPAYWTGYFTTRPFLKIMSRNLEHNLRNSEILYTFGLNKAKQSKNNDFAMSLQKIYPKLVTARRNLALFMHHDAITGTSRAKVMENYLDRMFDSLKDTISIQQFAIGAIMQQEKQKLRALHHVLSYNKSNELPENLIIDANMDIVLFNSLAHERIDVVTVFVDDSEVEVVDSDGNSVPFQLNPVFKTIGDSMDVKQIENQFEILFLVKLPALSLTKYGIRKSIKSKLQEAKIYTGNSSDEILIQNSKFRVAFDESTGFLKSLTTHENHDENLLKLSFGGYKTSKGKSGAYLFKPDGINQDNFAKDKLLKIIFIDGELATYIKVFYGKLLTHSVRLLKSGTHLDEGLYVENKIKMNQNHSDFEIFMRLKSSIENKGEFFTDLNGFQWQRRQIVTKIGIEGNYYPITTGMFLQDNNKRLTLLTSHAQGATSPDEGVIEFMLDRRTPVDDKRGMDEGVTDNIENIQRHWIVLEFQADKYASFKKYQVPTIHVSTLSQQLKYPINTYANLDKTDLLNKVEFFVNPLPCDIDLFNLRTLTAVNDENLPSQSALFIIQRKSYDCKYFISNGGFYSETCDENSENFNSLEIFNDLHVKFVQGTSLTGLKDNGYIESYNQNPIDAMEMRAYKMTFH